MTAKGDKREIGKNDKPNKLKFMEACESFDKTKEGIIKQDDLRIALSRSLFRPLPSVAQISMLMKSLEAYVSLEAEEMGGLINYRKVLEAPVSREFISINGIFPKIVRISYSLFLKSGGC